MTLRALSTAAMLATVAVITGCQCQEPPTLHGQVVDIWGTPVPDVTVALEGDTARPVTDANGDFQLPLKEGKQKIKAGKDGYIQEHVEIEIVAGEEAPSPTIALYPKPEENGFFVVSKGEYAQLGGKKVYAFGTELEVLTGVKEVDQQVSSEPFRVVFHTDLRMDEIMRLGLELHKLEYKKEAEFLSVSGPQEAKINLWSSSGEIDLIIDPMRTDNDYLITVEEGLESGYYAFHTQDLLDPEEPDTFTGIPEAMRVAFPFEIR